MCEGFGVSRRPQSEAERESLVTWMYSACEIGMRVRYMTRLSTFSKIGSRVVGRKYCDDVRNSLAALPRSASLSATPDLAMCGCARERARV